MESMSNAPLLVNKNLSKIGHGEMIDSMIHDGLWDAYNEMHMGSCAELLASERKYSRELQDKYAVKSYKKAQNIRRSIIELSYKTNSPHLGSSLSCVEILISILKRKSV